VKSGAIAFDSSRIIAVGMCNGSGEGGENAQSISLPGALVIPGFVDSHTHMLAGASSSPGSITVGEQSG